MSPPMWFMLAMLLATVFTWATGLVDFDYDDGPVLGFAHGFPGPASDWETGPDKNNVVITPSQLVIQRVSDQHAYAVRSFELPRDILTSGALLRVSGQVDTLRMASPEAPENIAALMVWFLDGNRQAFNYLTVRSLHGNEAHYSGTRIVEVPGNARHVAVAMLTRDSDGAFALLDATVQQIARPLGAKLVDAALIIIWGGLVLMAGWWVVRRVSMKVSGLLAALVVFTFVGVLMPETARMSVLQPLYHRVASLLSVSGDQPLALSFKIGHFFVFFFVAVVLLVNRRDLGVRAWTVLVGMSLLAVATEGLQLHLFDRTTRLSDVFIDIGGIGLALLADSGRRWLRNRRRSFRTSTRTLARMGLKRQGDSRRRHRHDAPPGSVAASPSTSLPSSANEPAAGAPQDRQPEHSSEPLA